MTTALACHETSDVEARRSGCFSRFTRLLDLDDGSLRKICSFLSPTESGLEFIVSSKRTADACVRGAVSPVFPGHAVVKVSVPADLLRFLTAPFLFRKYTIQITFGAQTCNALAGIFDCHYERTLSKRLKCLVDHAESVTFEILCRGLSLSTHFYMQLPSFFEWLRWQRASGSLRKGCVYVDLPDRCLDASIIAKSLGDLLGGLSNIVTLKDVMIHSEPWTPAFHSLEFVELSPSLLADFELFNTLQNIGYRPEDVANGHAAALEGVPEDFEERLSDAEQSYSASFGWSLESLWRFKNLKKIKLCDQFNYPLQPLALCKALEEVEIPASMVYKEELDDMLSSLPNLKVLDLSRNSSDCPLDKVFAKCRKLEVLKLGWRYNCDVDLSRMTRLRVFHCGRMFNRPLHGIDQCTALEELELGIFFDQPLEGLSSCKSLRTVRVGSALTHSPFPLSFCRALNQLVLPESVAEAWDIFSVFDSQVLQVVPTEDLLFVHLGSVFD